MNGIRDCVNQNAVHNQWISGRMPLTWQSWHILFGCVWASRFPTMATVNRLLLCTKALRFVSKKTATHHSHIMNEKFGYEFVMPWMRKFCYKFNSLMKCSWNFLNFQFLIELKQTSLTILRSHFCKKKISFIANDNSLDLV